MTENLYLSFQNLRYVGIVVG